MLYCNGCGNYVKYLWHHNGRERCPSCCDLVKASKEDKVDIKVINDD